MDRHRVGRSAALSVVQVIVAGGTLLFFYRYLLDTIGIAAVGIWSVVLATTSVGRIADFGIGGGVSRFVAKTNVEEDSSLAAKYVETALLSSAVITGLLVVLAFAPLRLLLARILPPNSITTAVALLPYALLSFWVVNITSVLQGGVDGALRVDLRNVIMIGSSFLQLGLGVLFVRLAGIMGLAYSQLSQAVIILVTTWLVLRRLLPTLSIVPRTWDYPVLRELIGFGWKLQLATVATVLFEPVTKALLTKFGGLASVGYYEMATRMVQQVRATLVNATQVLVPAIADSENRDPRRASALYRASYNTVSFLAIPIAGMMIVLLPAISDLWIGHYEERFTTFATLLTIGWFTNALTGPSYFTAIGAGRMRWNLVGHVLIATLNLIAGYTLGAIYGGAGVVSGAAIALVAGSVVIIVNNHREQGEPMPGLVPPGTTLLVLASIVGSAVGLLAYHTLDRNHNVVFSLATGLTAWLSIVAWPTWRHPARQLFTGWLMSAFPYSSTHNRPTRE